MSMIRIVCPHPGCGKSYRVNVKADGQTVVCKSCGLDFIAKAEADTSSVDDTYLPGHDKEVDRAARLSSARECGQPDRMSTQSQSETISRFLIRARLGQGAFGAVYRAYDPQLDREVAIKVPQSALLTSPELVERFLREAKAAARLNHPHIVPVYDAGQDGNQHYIASAFIDGQPLSELIETYREDYRQIAELVRKLAEALHYAHAQGIIHRDIKPHNIMIDAQGDPHLMDFGLAHVGDAAQKLTHDGTLMGTPAYMAPEQAAAQTENITAASDQYSLGIVLYELLTGQTPFSGSPAVVIYNILNQPIPPLRTKSPDLPRDLDTICTKSLSKESANRYPTCGDFAADLLRWLSDQPIRARRVGLGERFVRWCRREPQLATLIMLVMFAGLIAFGTVGIVLLDASRQGQLSVSWSLQDDAQTELEELRKERSSLRAQINTSESQRAALQQQLTDSRQNPQAANMRETTLTQELSTVRQQLLDSNRKLLQAEAQVNQWKGLADNHDASLQEMNSHLETVNNAYNRLFCELVKASPTPGKPPANRLDIGGVFEVTSKPPPPVRNPQPTRPQLMDRFTLSDMTVLEHHTFDDPTTVDPRWKGQCSGGMLEVRSEANHAVYLLSRLPPQQLCRIRVRVNTTAASVTQDLNLQDQRTVRIRLTPDSHINVSYSAAYKQSNGQYEGRSDQVLDAYWPQIVHPVGEWNELVMVHLEQSLILYVNGSLVDEFSLEQFPLLRPAVVYYCSGSKAEDSWIVNVDEFTLYELPKSSSGKSH